MTISAYTRTRVVVLLTSVALALAILLLSAVNARAEDSSDRASYVAHTVVSGDSLWDIAHAHVGSERDVRDLIEDIKRVNDLTSSVIVPGQVVLVPVDG
jgi:DNA-binding CsgD family transcriptional regulator